MQQKTKDQDVIVSIPSDLDDVSLLSLGGKLFFPFTFDGLGQSNAVRYDDYEMWLEDHGSSYYSRNRILAMRKLTGPSSITTANFPIYISGGKTSYLKITVSGRLGGLTRDEIVLFTELYRNRRHLHEPLSGLVNAIYKAKKNFIAAEKARLATERSMTSREFAKFQKSDRQRLIEEKKAERLTKQTSALVELAPHLTELRNTIDFFERKALERPDRLSIRRVETSIDSVKSLTRSIKRMILSNDPRNSK